MNRLCLSAALLFLLVILVDSTLVNIHHIQHEGLETSHRRGPKKHSTKDMIKNIIRGVATGAKIANAGSGFIREVVKAMREGNKGHVKTSGAQLKNHTVEESPTFNTQQLILSEKNKADSRPAFCLEPKVVGHGTTKMPRYFYNAKTGHCEPFTYGSLGGNKNNFLTIEDCMKTCGQGAGSLW
ncbi:trophoblast Kunitz domain protein 1-like [Bos javanicus]|uniref:trophoblast Kunitz domain protein 1-like n=1 Tax=Bos javanicus TaxID=9906 RepID=UPI002AA64390|nr:trophoblast Kunitz domain protein 1-like [Bos javanicus]